MRIQLDEVPLEVRRRAARHLEAIRESPIGANAGTASLGDEACPVYRPDVRGVAYWEFEVVGVKAATRTGTNGKRGSDRGFVLAATGAHDVPFPHWSLELEPPSRSLEAQLKGKVVARVVKLDALAYVAEDAKGTYLTHLGQFPPVPTSITARAAGGALSSIESHPTRASPSDKRVAKQQVKSAGADAPKPKLTPWQSWARAKRQYASAYKPHLAALRQRAEHAWEVEALVTKFGEGMHEGDTLVVPLLKPGKAELSGDGAASVKMTMLNRVPPAVQLAAGGADKKQEQRFRLKLTYDDGSSETLLFFVVPTGTPSNHRSVLPHLLPVPPLRALGKDN